MATELQSLPLLTDPSAAAQRSALVPAHAHYTCPGEVYPISRAVHLARLSAFYPACRVCQHRGETGQIPAAALEILERTDRRVAPASLFRDDGVRGIYLNQLDRQRAGQIAGALASLLWDDAPLIVRNPPIGKQTRQRRRGPTVVVGHDERPSSPDVVTGVAKILRRMGCHVIDVGLSTRPCFWFAVDHLQAAAGIHVTGSGCDPAWTGLDFVGAGAIPWSQDLRLPELEARLQDGFSRPLRQSAGQRTFHAAAQYESGLFKHFHALRPLRICCACPNRGVWSIIERTFARLACKLVPVSIPVRARELGDPEDADNRRMSAAIRQAKAHLGVLVDEDGQNCAAFDEQGRFVPARNLALVLAEAALLEAPGRAVVVGESVWYDVAPRVTALGGRPVSTGETLTAGALAMREQDAEVGVGGTGRYWFREVFPTCDGVLTIARILQALSRSDADFSAVAA